ncbi:MAG: bifunctional diaminohydroxyphosphoribosylaminopyrimidine deaminase/5-amino-6-(5-phosphoribosylamino)uracil reductase RibD [Bacteroidetes bacterium]|nr:bifunctional diaminohydroxyphosphoribosylaminopyrimidine deaminase/5-amino-6-(5-phosphoribosylamino)uracil reductase RibD [Bacteroidota bacterium]
MNHEYYMQQCLDLAIKGLGKTKSNPLVGSVIVHNNQIIGQGYHQEYGQAHAEVNAIESVVDQALLKDSTLYVNLEPCSHYGKTPPCANLIVKNKIPRVVIGALDTFSEVNGKGIELLRNAGIEVITDVLLPECRHLNRRFYTFQEQKRPYVILKWAQSLDGFMDKNRSENEKNIFWITQPEAKKLTHRWRAEEMAILVGRKTVEVDNPSLTVREYPGDHPIRIVLDADNKLQKKYKLFNNEAETIHLTKSDLSSFSLENILVYLHGKGINSILVEGGKNTLEQFINHHLWDEARVLTGNIALSEGLKAPDLKMKPTEEYFFGLDQVSIFFSTKSVELKSLIGNKEK